MFYLILTILLFGLSFLAGMMGLGVAFVATPVLGLFGLELKHEIMPLSLWLNGITAIASAVTLARKGMVDWRTDEIGKLTDAFNAMSEALSIIWYDTDIAQLLYRIERNTTGRIGSVG